MQLNTMVHEDKPNKTKNKKFIIQRHIKNYQLYLLVLPAVIYFVLFKYVPMYGIQIAFKNYMPGLGYLKSPWVGFAHFERFFNLPEFWNLIFNTLGISVYQLIAGFPLPILVALMLSYCMHSTYKRIVQTVIYAPHFISVVVLVGMVFIFLSPRTGLFNHLLSFFGQERIMFMGKPEWFKTIYVLSGIWQNTGWGTIIYLGALSSISPELYESAVVDGANKFQRIWYIDIPGILPTVVVLLILNTGQLMSVGFEKAFLMQTVLNRSASEVISTYVYKVGLLGAQFSFSSAVGLFNNTINFILLILVNKLAGKVSGSSLF